MNSTIAAISFALLSFAATPLSADEPAHDHPAVSVTDKGAGFLLYGEKMPEAPAPQALAKALLDTTILGKPVKLSGRIGQVCQQAGCWMMLTDGDAAVRVKFGEHAFVIPKDSQGEALVFGTLEKTEMTLAQSKHMAEDAGQDPAKVTQGSVEFRMVASSVRVNTP
jgi:Domain of unknown function (DUF4920)